MTTVSPSPSPSVSLIPNSLPKPPVCFSPPLIGMVVIIATAFFTITYSRAISRRFLLIRCRYRQWRRRRRLLRSYVPSSVGNGDIESPYSGEESYDPAYGYGYQQFARYGLDEAKIKTIPLSIHTRKSSVHECAVCLLEFEDDDYVRTLPVCFHSFHVDCIDIWLRCHANCPLCRSSVFRPESPFLPVMSPRIRPNFDNVIIQNAILEPPAEPEPEPETEHSRQNYNNNTNEITQDVSPSPTRDRDPLDDSFNRRNFLLKRSYSFGFERNFGSSRLAMETASPWRYRRSGGSFWFKKPSPSPFGLTKTRVFSFRQSRGMKSPFFRRRSCSFLPLSESYGGGCGSSSSRRRKSFASPTLIRQGMRVNSGMFSSSRLRSGDPEALLSPERYDRR
ncbi:putative transcription factor C2H2 family [Helianthus anomalus]